MRRGDRHSRRTGDAARGGRVDRKTLQLCGQIAQTLNYVITGELDDDVLRNLYVENVRPFPDAAHVLVSVSRMDANDRTPADLILQRLGFAAARLRSEVASSISRRKVPELSFVIVEPEPPAVKEAREDDAGAGEAE